MKEKGIVAELKIAPSTLRSSSHDRWLFSDTKSHRLPSPDTAMLDQWSEICETTLTLPFEEWCVASKDIFSRWITVKEIPKRLDGFELGLQALGVNFLELLLIVTGISTIIPTQFWVACDVSIGF